MVNPSLTIEHTTVTLELGANFIINMIIVAFYNAKRM